MRESWSIGRHRWTAIWNGIIIGMGVVNLFFPTPTNIIGIVLIAVGVGMEYWQRRRTREQL